MPIQKDPEGMELLQMEKVVHFSGRQVLDIGCGDGRLTWKYAPFTGKVTGIDLDMSGLLKAKTTCSDTLQKTTSFARASSLDIPFPNGKFDIAILSWTL